MQTSDEIVHYPPIVTVSCIHAVPTISSQNLHQLLTCATQTNDMELFLQSFVCFRGMHYVSICRERNGTVHETVWVEYSDEKKEFFFTDESMINHCIQTKSLPVLLFFSDVSIAVCVSSRNIPSWTNWTIPPAPSMNSWRLLKTPLRLRGKMWALSCVRNGRISSIHPQIRRSR